MRNRIAVAKAEEVASAHGRNPYEVARRLGFRVFYEELPGGCEEMVLPDLKLLFLRPENREHRHRHRTARLVAHALGHHFLHTGNQVYADPLPGDHFARHEKQAEAFAYTLLFGPKVGASL